MEVISHHDYEDRENLILSIRFGDSFLVLLKDLLALDLLRGSDIALLSERVSTQWLREMSKTGNR